MNNDLQNIQSIQRPKLMMAAAKELVNRRKIISKPNGQSVHKNVSQKVQQEAELEKMRISRAAGYSVDKQIKLLAELIEFVYIKQKLNQSF